ncbi:hypothetical protein TSAR_011438 [Trichomalopsis sarcophagae]|uniref:Uncharacterized protein n=1 Tax=Trichomalopsis sarcophagae TaxID=543379 RepID=A0A232EJF4_9HYME|nr:hypothetical protein TSAR_011438 [Trichomalopsis sarcophagae]
MGSSTKHQKVRSDKRRMTGNVNIYICSESVEKNEKNAEENVTQTTAASASSTSLISEKSRQKVGPVEEHSASPNRVRKKLADKPTEKQHNDIVKKDAAKDSDSVGDHEKLISTTEYNKYASYESKPNPTAGENVLKNLNEPRELKINSNDTRYDRSKLVSCRCPRFDESDLWLQKALKRLNRDSNGIAPSYSVKKADSPEERSADAPKNSGKSERIDKMCTCDRIEKQDSKGIGACDQLCTCCCIDVHKKENICKKINKKQASEFEKETSKSSHDKKESSLGKKDEKIVKDQAVLKFTNSKDSSKKNSKTKKSNSSEKVKSIEKVMKEEKSSDSKKSSKERLQPIEKEPTEKSKKDLKNVQNSEKKTKLSIKEKTTEEKPSTAEKPQEVKLQSKEKKKIKEEKKSTKTKDKPAIKENSENKSSEPPKSDKGEARDSAKIKKKKEKKTKAAFTDSNEKSTHRKSINDRKEDSFFSKLINMMKSEKKVSHGDVKKQGCSPDCTGLTKATETLSKNKSKREKSGPKLKPSGTIVSNGSHNIPEKFHDFKSAPDTQVNDTVDLNSPAKTEDDDGKSVPQLETSDKTLNRSKAEDENEEFRYYDNRLARCPEITKIEAENKVEPHYGLERNCSCYDCLRESEAARGQFTFPNSYPHEAYSKNSFDSCCGCKSQTPVTNFKEDRRRRFDELEDYPLVGSVHCCWCSCRDSA